MPASEDQQNHSDAPVDYYRVVINVLYASARRYLTAAGQSEKRPKTILELRNLGVEAIVRDAGATQGFYGSDDALRDEVRRLAGLIMDTLLDLTVAPSGAPTRTSTMSIELALAYDALGLCAPTSHKELLVAYRGAMLRAHPDAGGDTAFAQRINLARELVEQHIAVTAAS